MVERLIDTALVRPIRSLIRPIGGLHQAAYLLAGLTLASQVLGLVRDRIFAHQFGASELLDIYYAAFRMPDVVFALVASTVSAYVLIPRIAGSERAEARKLLSHAASFLLVVSGVLGLVLCFFAPTILFTLFPSFVGSAHADAFILLSRILLIQPILLGLSGVITSVTQVERRFFLFALAPVFYNLGIILGTVFLYPSMGLMGIGVGVIGGATLHLLINVPSVVSAGLFPRLVIPSPKLIWSVVRESVPRSLALSMGAVVTLALTVLVAKTGEGAIAMYALAGNLAAVPLALIGASYATAAFPVLAEHLGAKRQKEFLEVLTTAARHLIFWSTTSSVLIIVLRAHIVRVIFGSGEFDWEATRITAAVLAVLVIAITAQGLSLLASRAFYAAGRSWYPLMLQVVGAVLSIAGAYGFLYLGTTYPVFRYFVEALLRTADLPGSLAVLVALGAALGQICMGLLTLVTLSTIAQGLGKALIRPTLEGLGAGIVGGAAAYGTLAFMGSLAALTTLVAVLAQGAIAGMVGLVTAASVLFGLENKEIRTLLASLKGFSTKALPPQSEL